ncbi:LuxR C-terminal-related transcriptional regulator [Cupriavidus taiwanensis]|uniref:Putative ATP-dependent transcriptional regulator n=1 Tax=Cupriavidus taiwanensis TaxID=164546 RepID=A0A375I9M7_9BURK|nr:LuxR C-terminal-related transcriptional regulator [Cupriavidus taiwanensis]SOZ27026.1 putative ATP-dependent transcriptional regulator [Cupriavidus taiwanensis]SPA36676.1 putative ATP-dependent transcriptional regulator [Cupriavidus taiwanensis]SPK70199.1 putative ATP-dependent transcriptional regulator [Cupriavidus taiwanensis]SPK74746.1 putative ATP-dependent transcriptional regulator [Cupriavidus taiwanensis]
MAHHPFPLAARVSPPRARSRDIQRERLLARLEAARECKLVLLSAGAGSGKTTLLGQWRHALIKARARVAWLSLAPQDQELRSFCAALCGALQAAGIAGDWESRAGSLARMPPAAAAGALADALAAIPGHLWIMIDQFHHARDREVVALVRALADPQWQHLSLVIASRTTVPLPLGRLRASGELFEAGPSELWFDPQETRALLRLRLGTSVPLDTVIRVQEASAGWPAGVQLLASAQRDTTAAAAVDHARGTPGAPALQAYFDEEILADVDAGALAFMRHLSLLDGFCEGLAAHVTGDSQTRDRLDALASRHLLIVAAGHGAQGEHYRYRFPPMLGRCLRDIAGRAGIDAAAVHRRAAGWYARHGMLTEGLWHAMRCDDFALVVRLCEDHGQRLPSVTQLREFRLWTKRQPPQRLAAHPQVQMLAAWASIMTVRPDEAEHWLARLEAGPGRAQVPAALITLARAAICVQRDDSTQAWDLLQGIAAGALPHPDHEAIHAGLRVRCLAALGRHDPARPAYDGPLRAAGMHGPPQELMLLAAAAAACALLRQGNALEAEAIGSRALARAEAAFGRRSIAACACAAVVAETHYERNQLDAARQVLADRRGLLQASSPDLVLRAARCHARLLARQGHASAALSALRMAQAAFTRDGFARGHASMLAEQCHLAVHAGDLRHAAMLLDALQALASTHTGAGPRAAGIRALAALSEARLALAKRQPQHALALLDPLRTLATAWRREQWVVISDLLQARALADLGRHVEAAAALRLALASGMRLGLLRTLLDEYHGIGAMLAQAQGCADSASGAYLAQLRAPLDASAGTPATPAVPAPAVPPCISVPGLTPREQDIVALLDQAMSNKRIALALNISIVTVKWNLRQIFDKLGVSSRYEAIVTARALAEQAAARPAS